MSRFKTRLLAVAIALDCLGLSILKMGDHYRGATISAECWELEQEGKRRGKIFRPLVDFLFLWDGPNHCAIAWLGEAYIRAEYALRARQRATGGLS